jgi:hypothetical protein
MRAALLRALLISLAVVLSGCAAQVPRPAMVPLGSSGDFGYSERDLGPDRLEVRYRGDAVQVSPFNPRDDSRSKGELDKARDLALWRAAEIAVERGKTGLKIESETRDSDVVVQQRSYYRPNPFYDPFFDPFDDPFWPGYRQPFGNFYRPEYSFETVHRATTRAEVSLTVTLYPALDPKVEGLMSANETLARIKAARSGATY